MGDQRGGNFIPLLIKPARSIPKPLAKLPVRKCRSTQTDRIFLITGGNLNFGSSWRLRYCEKRMQRDYEKALNQVNSCHSFVNTLIKKNHSNKSYHFLLPRYVNYAPYFSTLIGTAVCEKKEHPKVKKISEKVGVCSNKTAKSNNRSLCKKNERQGVRKIPEKVSVCSNKTGKVDNRSEGKKNEHQEVRKLPEKVSGHSNKKGRSVCKKIKHQEVKKIPEKVSVCSNKTGEGDNRSECKKNVSQSVSKIPVRVNGYSNKKGRSVCKKIVHQEVRKIHEKVSVCSNKTGEGDNRSVGKKTERQEVRKVPENDGGNSNKTGKSNKRKSRSVFGIKKQETAIVDSAPVRNFNKKGQQQAQESGDNNSMNVLSELAQRIFSTVHKGMIKSEERLTKHKREGLDIVTNRVEMLSQILYLQTIAARNSSQILTFTNLTPPPPPPPPPFHSLQDQDAESSVIPSDTDCSDHNFHTIDCEKKSSSSSISSSSYIKSDSSSYIKSDSSSSIRSDSSSYIRSGSSSYIKSDSSSYIRWDSDIEINIP